MSQAVLALLYFPPRPKCFGMLVKILELSERLDYKSKTINFKFLALFCLRNNLMDVNFLS